MEDKNKRVVVWILSVLSLANVFAWSVVYDLLQTRPLEVNFFNVGQGDAVFIETPQGYQVLIDGGPGSVVLEKLAQEMPFWDRDLDLVVLTHPEHDHVAGLIEVLKRYQVDHILWTGVTRDTGEYEEWKKMVEEREGVVIARAGQVISTPQTKFYVLHPFESLKSQTVKNTNNSSVALSLRYLENSFLFTGDLYKSVENDLVERNGDLSSDVLKVGHHGSKTSTGKEFLEAVDPGIAVISAGSGNSYGHPHEEVLDILNDYDINILRTDRDGDIKIISDGQELHFSNNN
ncbi:MAG: MBL fold metallo-hydrolase [Candidatus Nealsonbacteria bacterium]|nr:MBL fold metallo-hydrolase [Candidatus Nealsonbacteria bacterium]